MRVLQGHADWSGAEQEPQLKLAVLNTLLLSDSPCDVRPEHESKTDRSGYSRVGPGPACTPPPPRPRPALLSQAARAPNGAHSHMS